jgi:hypothetical protein
MLFQKRETISVETVSSLWEISVPWQNQNNDWWNETCVTIMEVFGLPGDRYTSHPSEYYMLFRFKSKKDYQLCRILISERL